MSTTNTRILVVSLATALDRRAAFQRRAQDTTLEWSFYDAFRGLASNISHDVSRVAENKRRALTTAELGCYSSHFTLWQELLKDEFSQYIILEDDVIPDWKFLEHISHVDFAASNIHYLRLYRKVPCKTVTIEANFIAPGYFLTECVGSVFGTQAYVITKVAASAFLKASQIVQRPIDDQMDRSWEHKIPNLCIFPFPIVEEFVASSIEKERAGQPRKLTSRPFAQKVRRIAGKLSRLLYESKIRLRKRTVNISHFRNGG